MTILTGKNIQNRYQVNDFLGRGGMAEVYKVWDSKRMTFLAMKVLHEDLALDRVFMRRFQREAQTLAKLQHPNIVRFYGLEQDGRLAFMLLDFIEGETLKHKIFDAGGPMPLGEIRDVLRSLCGALQFAHSEGLVHCDIKPGNIMIDQHGKVLLSDFGIARMADAATATMVGMGTPAYMAPEQARGLDPTPYSDIYALGIVLFEMLTGGERPFTGEQAQTTGSISEKVRWEQMHIESPSPSRWNPKISPELEAVVLKSLMKNPDERYQTPLDLVNALEIALPGGDVVETETDTSQQAPVESVRQDSVTLASSKSAIKSESPDVGIPQPIPLTEPPQGKALPKWLWLSIGLAVIVTGFLVLQKPPERMVEIVPERVVETVVVTVEVAQVV
nr:serine/threonine protein kinase [Chloroflexota bacterium]